MAPPLVEQAGAVVYRRGDTGLRILLVRARRNPEDWIFPKGHVERGEKPAATAVREAAEEAGVTGRVVTRLAPAVTFSQQDRRIHVEYFLVEFERDVKPHEGRERAWLSPSAAMKRLTHDSARAVLERALKQIDT